MSWRTVLPVVAALGVFLVAWQLAVVLGGLQPSILPPPLLVAERLVEAFADGTIQPHLATTLQEIALGFAAGAVLGLVAGYVMARSPPHLATFSFAMIARSQRVTRPELMWTIFFPSGLTAMGWPE